MLLRIVKFFSTVLIAVSLTGSIYGLNVKLISIFTLLIFYLLSWSGKYTTKQFNLIVLAIPFLLFYFILALINEVPLFSIIDHFEAFFSVLLVLTLLNPVNKLNQIDEDILNGIIFSGALICVLKIGLWLTVLMGLISIKEVFDLIYDIFKFEFITLETDIGSRFHFPIDYILPLSLILFNAKSRTKTVVFGANIKFLFSAVTVLAIVLSYSRLLWAYSLLVFLMTFKIKDLASYYLLLFSSAMVGLVLIHPSILEYLSTVLDFIYERYFGVHANESDSARNIMFESLLEMFNRSPLIGSGLGSHSSFIKFPDSPWLYELQTFSLLAQFGVIGFILIISYLIYYFEFFKPSKLHGMAFKIFLVWLIVNSINCFLLISQGAIILIAIKCIDFYDAKKRIDNFT